MEIRGRRDLKVLRDFKDLTVLQDLQDLMVIKDLMVTLDLTGTRDPPDHLVRVLQGPDGDQGPDGNQGPAGATGPAGPFGAGIAADFYALMPGNNASPVQVGTFVQFPQAGANTSGGTITATGAATFQLSNIGTYQIFFQVSVTEAGQLALTSGGTIISSTVVGRATGTSQIVGMSLLTTTSVNTIISVINPLGNSTALTITPIAGGASPVSAHLVIVRIA